MRFFPPTPEPLLIALTSGHTAVVEPEGTALDPRFRTEAIALGCLPEGAGTADAPSRAGLFDRVAVVTAAIEAMLDGAGTDDFTADGKPNLKALQDRVGFAVSREERDRVWADIGARL